jgi:hypothetical protein
MSEKVNDDRERERHTRRLHLPGFITEEDVGLGDVVKRITYAAGIRPCGGCERRKATLNRWFIFSGPRRKKMR